LAWLALPGSLDAVHNFFMTYDITDFNHKQVRKTAALLDIVQQSKGVDADILQDLITSKVVFTGDEWMAQYMGGGMHKPSNVKQAELLATVGYERYQLLIVPGKPDKVRLCRPIGMDVDATRAAHNATHAPSPSPF